MGKLFYNIWLFFFFTQTDEESRILIFKEEVPNKALYGHVINTEQVLNEGSCRLQCYLEPNCVSINVGPLKDGSHQCNLNDVTDDTEFAVVLKDTTGFIYNGVEVRALIVIQSKLRFNERINDFKLSSHL